VHGVIAFSPSAVSWSNTVHPFHSGETKPTFTFQNNPVPFIAMPPLTAGTSDTIATLPYWYSGLDDSAAVANAFIPIQQITGPVLLLSGEEDAVWPSAMMGNMLMERLAANDFKYAYQHVVYPNAGHLISGNPNYTPESQFGSMPLDGNAYVYGFGGSPAGDKAAQVDAANQVFRFLEAL
jgi:pimeloyl-ACP methyl ester carboxylesterase